jgi:membrane dipeptidase
VSVADPTVPIADCHNDLLVDLAYHRHDVGRFGEWWLPNLRRGGVVTQVCPISVELDQLPETALRRSLEQILVANRTAEAHPEDVMLVRSRADLDAAARDSVIALILALEGVEPIGYTPDLIDIFWLLGVRMASLTWNRQNPFAAGAAEAPAAGLTNLGRELIGLMTARGIAIDLAHASEATFYEVLSLAEGAPVLVSHACCRSVFDTPRNLSDEQLRALAAADGLFGVMGIPLGVDPEHPTLDRLVDHIRHAVDIIGVERVALGADFMAMLVQSGVEPPFAADTLLPPGLSMGVPIDGFASPEDFPRLIEALSDRGFTAAEIESIAHANLTRFMREALPAGAAVPGR